MGARIYISNLSKAWPEARQREVLKPVTEGSNLPEYRDQLTRRGLQSRKPELLEERADMLRPTSRRSGETIYCAALGVLAVSPADLASVLAAAAARRATIILPGDDLTIPPDPPASVLADVMAQWEKRRRQGLHEGGRLAGQKIAVERRRAATAAALDLVRDDWGKPSSEVSTKALMERAGLTYKTLNEHLGPRTKAQRAFLRREQRLARREKTDEPE